ncbi:putative F-box protein PP2-B12 [Forsythia ovata]|uniref:F-box protein PP2-B12 n=1 Tax=Forsythia ovata TaxID=205694 RepID=A0ABD1PHA1_9LAMI
MSQNYDNWERIVEAVLRREELRQVALYSSREPSFSSISSSFITEPATPIHDDQNIQLGSSSNTVNETDWDRLLPSDYEDIIARSVNPVAYATKKDLYLSLCDSPILLDGGNTSFHIDKTTGKKCVMIGARKLKIFCGEIPEFWEWTSHKDSRFLKVAKLKQVFRFDIRGQIELKILSPKTTYAAYLVFGFAKSYNGSLWSTYGSIGFVNNDKDVDAHKRANTLHLIPGRDKTGNIAVMRPDRWMEVEIGNFYTDQEYNSELEARHFDLQPSIFGTLGHPEMLPSKCDEN